MDAWELHRYDRPYLRADKLYADGETVVVVADGEDYDIAVPGGSADEVLRLLEEMRDPGSPRWKDLATADDPLREILSALDTLGIVGNSDDGGGDVAEAERRDLLRLVDDLASWLLDPARPWDKATLVGATQALRTAADRQPAERTLPLVEIDGATSFPLTTLVLQRRYWESCAPLAAAAVRLLVATVAGEDDPGAVRTLDDLAGGPEEPRDVSSALHCAASLLALSTRPDAPRICEPPPYEQGRLSGINLALTAERAARLALDQIGPTGYITALEEGRYPKSFVQGACIEEYHITRRFVETITPALARRHRDRLRGLVFRYYDEELGHERYERATCMSLGIGAELLDEHHPMPFHLAYADAYIAIARTQPIAYLASVMVTEGLPGDPFGINDLLDPEQLGEEFAAVFQEHEAANTDMAHTTLARLLLTEVPSVSPGQVAATLDCVTYLIELTHRAWNLLYDLHSGGPWSVALPPAYFRQRDALQLP